MAAQPGSPAPNPKRRGRLAAAMGAFGGLGSAFGTGLRAATSFAHKAADIGSDVLGGAGVGSPGYSMTPTDERYSRMSGYSSTGGGNGTGGDSADGSGDSGPNTPPLPPTPPLPGPPTPDAGGPRPDAPGGPPPGGAGGAGEAGAGAGGAEAAAVAL
jgi:hypothetical protein